MATKMHVYVRLEMESRLVYFYNNKRDLPVLLFPKCSKSRLSLWFSVKKSPFFDCVEMADCKMQSKSRLAMESIDRDIHFCIIRGVRHGSN